MTETHHFNKLTETEQERLALLFEDCSEIIHAVGKIIRHGFESEDPTKFPEEDRICNREMLSREIGQLFWTVDQMLKSGDLFDWAIEVEEGNRRHKAFKYLHHHKIK